MKITVQIVLHADDDTETVVREAFTVQRGALAPETLGLQAGRGQRPARHGAGHARRAPGHRRAGLGGLRARTAESRTGTRTVGPSR